MKKPEYSQFFGPLHYDIIVHYTTHGPVFGIYDMVTYDIVDAKDTLDEALHERRRLTWLKIVQELVEPTRRVERANAETVVA